MKLKAHFRLVILLFAAVLGTQASIIAAFDDQITLPASTMLGRISRNGVSSDWSGPKAWPGVINTTTTYNYKEYKYGVPFNTGNYFQIEVYSDANIFASAYEDSFTPAPGPTPTNYLGDEGLSGFFNGLAFFQIYVPSSHMLDLVLNTTAPEGIDSAYSVTVESFSDTMYTDPVPEPASIALALAGLATFVLARRRLTSKR